MPILKAPPTQPKNETVQLRVSQDLKFRLMRYAEFIHATAAYVVSETLERLFRKDAEFQKYLAAYKSPESGNHSGGEKALNNALNSAAK
jgi:predicted transcriptional regulator